MPKLSTYNEFLTVFHFIMSQDKTISIKIVLNQLTYGHRYALHFTALYDSEDVLRIAVQHINNCTGCFEIEAPNLL